MRRAHYMLAYVCVCRRLNAVSWWDEELYFSIAYMQQVPSDSHKFKRVAKVRMWKCSRRITKFEKLIKGEGLIVSAAAGVPYDFGIYICAKQNRLRELWTFGHPCRKKDLNVLGVKCSNLSKGTQSWKKWDVRYCKGDEGHSREYFEGTK